MLIIIVMVGRILASVALGLGLLSATARLPAIPCLVTNTPSEKACQADCCANKSCCETSHQRTGPPAQPFAKSAPDQYSIAALPPVVTASLVAVSPAKTLVFSARKCFVAPA